ncbi:MAG: O-antigen ligase family protein [Deltaproteobacteria bacterium]|jgi:O-antigen ligase|nr:O-antigen ligase family protein [Deltaproteobacteria bacterium]
MLKIDNIVEQGKYFRLAGPVFLFIMAFSGVFARGIVNIAAALLIIWAIILYYFRSFFHANRIPPLPRGLFYGFAIYFAILILTSLLGENIPRSLMYVGVTFYVLLVFPATCLAISQMPESSVRILPYCYGAGILVASFITFQEAHFTLSCTRAPAHMGIIPLSVVLSQLSPMMVAALAVFGRDNKKSAIFFLLVLLGAYVALRNNCTRMALLVVPVLGIMMFFAFRKYFGKVLTLIFVLVLLICSVTILMDKKIIDRFKPMFDTSGTVASNEVRYTRWKNGIEVWKENPVFGVGPISILNVPCMKIAVEERDCENQPEYYHSHQLFITILAESGVLGLIGFLLLHIVPLWYLWPGLKMDDALVRFWCWCSLAVFLQLFLNGLTDYVFSTKAVLYIYWTTTATAFCVLTRKNKELLAKPIPLKPRNFA